MDKTRVFTLSKSFCPAGMVHKGSNVNHSTRVPPMLQTSDQKCALSTYTSGG